MTTEALLRKGKQNENFYHSTNYCIGSLLYCNSPTEKDII